MLASTSYQVQVTLRGGFRTYFLILTRYFLVNFFSNIIPTNRLLSCQIFSGLTKMFLFGNETDGVSVAFTPAKKRLRYEE